MLFKLSCKDEGARRDRGSQGSIVQPARHPRAPLPPDAVQGVYNGSRPKRQHKPTAPIAGPGAMPRFM
ncbi:hypothetical protein NEUTE1DRAFT_103219 [Neurospora tetrasperma FGSC 2508]|uniref:Uncharacterized protein n=1 Tax=Neurospora tetrasperma (strain FGSC 2508 / ATCC MYA-4615 / P0657) TaxID=510951 RepID=F8MRW3_NEUT8|nr:uncharacterized protein NEUTE1DRAFT_103219 [Neurospora tetrasperma FGSC 2508]EGO55809.1 hypothetical protein NEUTE1DRAFT_103219 [Neurospora tetrasperma FGSC 2508]